MFWTVQVWRCVWWRGHIQHSFPTFLHVEHLHEPVGILEGGGWVWGKYRGRNVRWAYYVHRDESYVISTHTLHPMTAVLLYELQILQHEWAKGNHQFSCVIWACTPPTHLLFTGLIPSWSLCTTIHLEIPQVVSLVGQHIMFRCFVLSSWLAQETNCTLQESCPTTRVAIEISAHCFEKHFTGNMIDGSIPEVWFFGLQLNLKKPVLIIWKKGGILTEEH